MILFIEINVKKCGTQRKSYGIVTCIEVLLEGEKQFSLNL